MAHRAFKDAEGRDWEVWDVVPSKWVGPTLDGGWLALQSAVGRGTEITVRLPLFPPR